MNFKEIVMENLEDVIKESVTKNLEDMLTKSYYQCEDEQKLKIFGNELAKYESLEEERLKILKSFNISDEQLDKIDELSCSIAAIYAKRYFIAGAKEMLKGAF